MYWQDVEKLVRICATVMGNRVLTPPKAKQNHRQMSCAACRPQAPGTESGDSNRHLHSSVRGSGSHSSDGANARQFTQRRADETMLNVTQLSRERDLGSWEINQTQKDNV